MANGSYSAFKPLTHFRDTLLNFRDAYSLSAAHKKIACRLMGRDFNVYFFRCFMQLVQ